MGAGQPVAGAVADVSERGDSGRDAASGAKGGAARAADAVSARDAGCADDAGCAHGAGCARDAVSARDTGHRGDIVSAVVSAPAGGVAGSGGG
jgi:hypothetical protein